MFVKIKDICEKGYNNFLVLPNVNGIAVGYKIINGINTGALCLKVLVEKKVQENNLSKQEIIPKFYNGIVTDVIEVGVIKALANTTKIRPAVGGYSVGVAGTNVVGTLGCLVSRKSGTSLQTFILSNNHVIAGENLTPIGSLILQQGQGDGGINPTDGIANLSEFVTINFSGGNNIVDAAIAEVISTSLVSKSIADVGNITGIDSALIGGAVKKSGRTTGLTVGSIIGVNATLNVAYGAQNALFINQIITTAMSSGGDSGSIVLDDSNRVIGLLFAGSASITAMNDIRDVLKSFRARLI